MKRVFHERPGRSSRRDATPRRATVISAVAVLLASIAGDAVAGDPPPFTARAGVDLAHEAAAAWAEDAELIYVENDEPVDADGNAERWGYLFYSRSGESARGYSVRDGKIKEATNLGFDFPAPPLADEWIDSRAALAEAEKAAGAVYRRDHAGHLDSMLLIRGAFDEKHPDASTWTFVYSAESAPSLFVVIDAAAGKVVRIWKG